MVHDTTQLKALDSARVYERYFATMTGSHRIGVDYLARLNLFLDMLYEAALDSNLSFERHTDVVEIDIESDSLMIKLHFVGIRPCFRGHGLFVILVYQLVLAARASCKKLTVCSCMPITLKLLQRHFGVLATNSEIMPDCLINCQSMLIDGVTETDKGVHLIPTSFPTSSQLNDRVYVDMHFAHRL